MAQYDLTALMAAQMDCHLVFPMLEFLQERQLYADEEILQGKICLLSGTNMVDYAMDIHKSLHGTDDVPADMVARRSEVVERLRTLQEAVKPIVDFLSNPQLVQELRADNSTTSTSSRSATRSGRTRSKPCTSTPSSSSSAGCTRRLLISSPSTVLSAQTATGA